MEPKPIKKSIAFVVYNPDHSKILIVKRPSDDDKLPNIWGLPAASLKASESWEDCVIRAGHEKLGVKLKIIKLLNEGKIERDNYTLHMKEYEVQIISGEPKVPQPIKNITQYQEYKFGKPTDLEEAAQKGSLCSQLFLDKNSELNDNKI